MLAEGKNPVYEALATNKNIEKIFVLDGVKDNGVREMLSLARARGIRVEYVRKEALDRVSKTGHHQGIIAYLAEFEYSALDEVLQSAGRKFFILLDKITDPHNLGSIIRSAECVGVTAVIIPDRGSALVNETVLRTSAGAASHVRIVKVGNLNDAIRKIKDSNIFVYAADMDGKSIYETNLVGDIAIVIGSEGDGVSKLTKRLCDGVVAIPMKGRLNSLNASVSAGIIMFEVLRQNGKRDK